MGRVLVTGGAGYIGSHATLALQEANVDVVIADNLSTGHEHVVPAGVPLERADVRDVPRMRQILESYEIDAVMHFAGSIVVPDSVRDPLGYYDNNVYGSLALLQACVQAGVGTFIFSSTAAVYGENSGAPVNETMPTEPTNPYGMSKLMTERIIKDSAAAHGFRYGILRYFNVAGADPQGRAGQCSPKATHLIKVACETALGLRPPITVFGDDYPTSDGTCIRDYIHVSDLADAHVRLLGHLRDGGDSQTLNCAYGHGHSVLEVLEMVGKVCGHALDHTIGARRPGDVASLTASVDLLRTKLGWQPRFDHLETIVETALAWERKYRASR